jgi:hypothetical protein
MGKYRNISKIKNKIYFNFLVDLKMSIKKLCNHIKILSKQKRHKSPTTPCCTVLPEKLTVTQLVMKTLAFYGPEMFTTAFTRSHQPSQS